MRSIALAWEATQDHYGFEAMIFHIPGSRNGFSDACSRDPCQDSPSTAKQTYLATQICNGLSSRLHLTFQTQDHLSISTP